MKWIFLLLAGVLIAGCYYDNKEDLYQYVQQQECNVTSAAYTADIVPLLKDHCYQCHRNERQDGNVNVEGYVNAKIYADNGSLYGTANHETGYSVMPTSGVKIPFCDLEKLRMWIENGALND